MEPLLDLSKEYGIVLDGGGARGAYQIGAWKALKAVSYTHLDVYKRQIPSCTII